jgi:hypothetical protein
MSTKIEFRAGAIGSLIGSFAFGSDPRAYFGSRLSAARPAARGTITCSSPD